MDDRGLNLKIIGQTLLTCFVILAPFVAAFVIWQDRQGDVLIAFFVFIVSFGLYATSFKSKNKILLRLCSILILFNFLIFPLCYLICLTIYPDSFNVENTLMVYIKAVENNSAKEEFDINNNQKGLNTINYALNSNSIILTQKTDILDDKNLHKIDTIYFLRTNEIGEPNTSHLMFYGQTGLLLCDLWQGPQIGNIGYNSIKDLLYANKQLAEKRLNEYKSRTALLKTNEFWS